MGDPLSNPEQSRREYSRACDCLARENGQAESIDPHGWPATVSRQQDRREQLFLHGAGACLCFGHGSGRFGSLVRKKRRGGVNQLKSWAENVYPYPYMRIHIYIYT